MSITRRDVVGLFGASAIVGAPLAAHSTVHTQTADHSVAPRSDRGNYLIRGGATLTVDPLLGTLPRADILIRNGVIEKVAARITIDSSVEVIDAKDMIVMPGLIDTHCHLWETVGRSFLTDDADYFKAKLTTATHYTPEDFYNSVILGLVEQVSCGVTTVHNWSHNALSPATVDAELRAHRDSLLRSRYSYGPNIAKGPTDTSLDYADIDRVRRQWFGSAAPFEGLVHLGVNIEGKSQAANGYSDIKQAIERGLPFAAHESFDPPPAPFVLDFQREGYLGPNCLVAHLYSGTQPYFEALGRHRTPLTFAPYTVLGSHSDAHVALAYLQKYGVTVALSSDAASVGPLDMLELVRVAWTLGNSLLGPAAEGKKYIPFRDAIAMGTINGAKALGLDRITGSLTPGKRADLILIDANALGLAPASIIETAVVMSASSAQVDTVIVDGRIMKRGGKLLAHDLRGIRASAQASALNIRKRVGGWLTPTSV